jgi:hypothetical protein
MPADVVKTEPCRSTCPDIQLRKRAWLKSLLLLRTATQQLFSVQLSSGSEISCLSSVFLSELKRDEVFFSIDEFGPFAVKKREEAGSGSHLANTIRFRTGGRPKVAVIITAALELSHNQATHVYSDKKIPQEMIKMTDLLRTQHRNCSTIYPLWDAAS